VDWIEAVAFCRWLNHKLAGEIHDRFGEGTVIRLPTEWEWQQAGTGGNPGNTFPWGPEWKEGLANTEESGLSGTVAVGLYPQGASQTGALDMAGSVWEWCLNEYDKPNRIGVGSKARRVVRGGSWFDYGDDARTASRYHYHPTIRDVNLGLRLLCGEPPSPKIKS
jgi:formylglycine-generating enzyme required for sulfatase activity